MIEAKFVLQRLFCISVHFGDSIWGAFADVQVLCWMQNWEYRCKICKILQKKKFAPTGFFLALDYFGPFGNLKSVPPENIGKITIAIFWRGANMPWLWASRGHLGTEAALNRICADPSQKKKIPKLENTFMLKCSVLQGFPSGHVSRKTIDGMVWIMWNCKFRVC